ncbi:hypothetical protein O181_006873 [Austropuccinia psidii MF-1]|uniref:Uncharacterized protein n=1 Tax=Austropuccinia psidii MF-1 TaxID=1389203 RepID=A0A9Q3BLA9_9BASI|nr:hypothetical protein [Austropuccinia psidii MF-1]
MTHKLRNPLEPEDLLLVNNKPIESQLGLLFKNYWNGPYRVINQINNGPYELSEFKALNLQENLQQVTSRGFIPEERWFNQVQSQEMKAVNKLKMKSKYWREKELKKMDMLDISKLFNWNAGDSIKWRM